MIRNHPDSPSSGRNRGFFPTPRLASVTALIKEARLLLIATPMAVYAMSNLWELFGF